MNLTSNLRPVMEKVRDGVELSDEQRKQITTFYVEVSMYLLTK